MTPYVAIADDVVGVVTASGQLATVTEHGATLQRARLSGVIAVERELWGLAADRNAIVRCTTAGQIGEPLAVADRGRLDAGTYGRSAIWQGAQPQLVQLDGETWHTRALPPGIAIGLGGARVASVTAAGIAMPHAGREHVVALPSGYRVRAGAAIFDATAVCLLADTQTGAVALVIGVDGSLRLRLALVGARAARIAAQRGQLVVQVAPERLAVIDLRFGKIARELVHGTPILDFAVDRGGYAIAVVDVEAACSRYAYRDRHLERDFVHAVPSGLEHAMPSSDDDETEIVDLAELIPDHARRARGTEPPANDDAAQPQLGAIEPPPRQRISLAANVVPRSLMPRSREAPSHATTADISLVVLRDELRTRCAVAIARGWDTGRIAFTRDDVLPCQAEVAALVAPLGGRASAQLDRAHTQLHVATAARLATEAHLASTPLGVLLAELGLGAVERDVLVAIVAPALWPELARLYTIVGNGRPSCDTFVIGEVLRDRVTERQLAEVLAPDAPLVRLGLVVADRVGSFAPTAQVVRRLHGAPDDRDPDRVFSITCAADSIDALVLDDRTRAGVRALLDDPSSHPLRLVVRGRPGSGRRTLLARLGALAHRPLALIDATPYVHASPPRLDALAAELRRAHLAGWLPCIDGLAGAPDDPHVRAQLAAIGRDHPGPLCTRLPADGRPAFAATTLDVHELAHSARVAAWSEVLAGDGDAQLLASRWAIGPGTMHRAVARAGTRAELDDAVRGLLDDRLASLAARVRYLPRWDDVILPPELLDSLAELIARVRHRDDVFERWGLARIATTGRGVVALFQGGPGTGKTLVAGAIARELGLDMYRVDLARVVSKWIGETERNLGALFDAAEDGNAILLFDEADSLFAKRTEVRTSVDRYANLEVNYLLQRLDSFTGIAILTSNFGNAIDEAFKRRLSFRLAFPFPDEDLREQLWQVHLPPTVPRAGELDLGTLARKHALAGGYIRNAALRAAFLAAGEGSALRQEHLERAIHLEYREIGRLSDTGRAD